MLGRWLLFLSSYSPLLALTAVRLDSGGYRTGLYWLAGAGAVALMAALAASRRIAPRDRVATSVSDRGGDVAGYLATYLLPFLTVSDPAPRDVISYAGFVLLVGVVYTRSTLLSVNPLLYVLGYRLVFLSTGSGQPILLICRSIPTAGDRILVRPLFTAEAICIEA